MKSKTAFFCSECGFETPKWSGRCQSCGAWNTMVEAPVETKQKCGAASVSARALKNSPELLSSLGTDDELRFTTGFEEFDRVLGGGAVRGSLVLVGGAPGIGKSTLLLQFCGKVDKNEKILYVTGEESKRQLKMRAERLGADATQLYVLAETDLNEIISAVDEIKPDVLIIDSVQTMFNPELTASPGSVTQVKDCTMAIMQLAKSGHITAFIVGHVNKEGAIAGPKVLEHMVDCVLYFEGERGMSYRILRAAKNRFGSTNEIGVFEMTGAGLSEVDNPSMMLLSGRPNNVPGSCVTSVMEGSRPLLIEVQALVSKSGFATPRRMAAGFDYNRMTLLIAVLEKRGGYFLGGLDAFINIVGGFKLDEPGADLAVILALASSIKDKPIPQNVVAFGEVGLSGEVRSVSNIHQRITEAARLGFNCCIVPHSSVKKLSEIGGNVEILGVKSISEAFEKLG